MQKDIAKLGNPVLRKKAKSIDKIDQQIKDLADLLTETLIQKGAYGIAAPQLGISKSITVIDVDDFFQVLINPEIVKESQKMQSWVEGCLSIPGVDAEVKRDRKVTVKGVDLQNKLVNISADGLLARVLQHEMDHLNGVLFIDHLGVAKRNQLLKEYERKKNSPTKEAETAS